jgi:hypothetical protein
MAWTPESRFRSSASLEGNKKHQSALSTYQRTFIRTMTARDLDLLALRT